MTTTLVRRARLAGAAIFAVLVLAACGGGEHDTANGRDDSSPASTLAGEGFNETDVAFAQDMIVHHEQALEMVELAESQASDPELLQLAAEIKAAQEPEITIMTGWLTDWSEPIEPAGGHGGHTMPGMMSDGEMAALSEATGVDFDRMFVRMMIAHHNGAIQMARDVQARGLDEQVKALAATIEQEQAAEVAVLEEILDRL